MNLTDREILELTALCNAMVDGTLADAPRARLEQWLAASEEARRFYVRYVGLSASLVTYAGEMQSEAPDLAPVASRIVRPVAWRWTLGSLAAAACVLLGLWVGGFFKTDPASNQLLADHEREETVARLSGAKDCRWKDGAWQPGDEFRRGQRLELTRGFAEITFDSGAQITLEGPASLDLNSAWDAMLNFGSIKAGVPPEAIGFRIANAAVEVVDLGTEFSMVADRNGATEVFVLKGAVEAAPRDARGREHEAITLREKQARRFARGGVSEVADKEKKLARFDRKVSLDRVARPANYLHWAFDEASGDTAVVQTFGATSTSTDVKLVATSDSAQAAARTDGRWGRALRFDGKLSAKARVVGISKRAARTVAFWVRLPKESGTEGEVVAGWPLAGASGRAVDIGVNGTAVPGAAGAVRSRVGRKFVVGSSPLRDGRWHHVAVVISPMPKSEAAFQLKHYVDGRFEAVSKRQGGNRWPSATESSESAGEWLWLGQRPGGGDAAAERLHGDIDELFIADRALTPQEIRHLMKQNKPAQLEVHVAGVDGVHLADTSF